MPIIDDDLLETFRHGPCAWCKKKVRTDPHHLTSRGFGGGLRFDVPENLVAFCRDCHMLAHQGRITRGEITHLIAKRLGITAEAVMDRIYQYRREDRK